MAANEEAGKKVEKKEDEKSKTKAGGIADYLNAPRKKRKSYVVFALTSAIPADLQSQMEAFIRNHFKGTLVIQCKTPQEFQKNFNRQILLVIYDHEFTDLQTGLEMVRDLKDKKGGTPIPVLFLTRDPHDLVEGYNKTLLAYHEADEYINYPRTNASHIFSKIRYGLANKNRRRSRRYKVDVPLTFMVLGSEGLVSGRLLDLSIHGALLKAETETIFREHEQLKLHLPINEFLPLSEGEFLRISARVRRVFISGNQVGLSFEHISERQRFLLTRYLTEMVNMQLMRRSLALKAKMTRSSA